MKIYILLATVFCYLGYSVYMDKINTPEIRSFYQNTINNLFLEYEPEIVNVTDKDQVITNYLFIKPENLTFSKFQILNDKIKRRGWVQIKSDNEYYQYCFENKYFMKIVFPDGFLYKNNPDQSKDKVWVDLTYTKGGVSTCTK
ncbi:hypothetical protein DT74_12200 [Acinetobacter sp. ETR1]|nr:hypothetical protein DT74_12200 [Acinetobacter sp. ETR1]BAP36562.1 hypothetical protein AS4_16220 [Acinetobacter guillouiae]